MHIVTPRGSAKNKTEMKLIRAFLVAQMVENQSAMQETWVWLLSLEDPLEKGMVTQSSILPGESYGQRGLEGYSPWGCKERNMIEVTYHARMMTDLRVFKSQVHSWA